jgi:hypothetical protein
MPLSLHAAFVPSCRQIIGGCLNVLAKAEAAGIGDLATATLAPDMFPLAFQVQSVAGHSAGAIAAVRTGQFSPGGGFAMPDADFGSFTAMLKDAGASYVILGHSERRMAYRETSHRVRAKAEAAMAAGLIPVVCVGEPEDDRLLGRAEEVVAEQMAESLPDGFGAAGGVVSMVQEAGPVCGLVLPAGSVAAAVKLCTPSGSTGVVKLKVPSGPATTVPIGLPLS